MAGLLGNRIERRTAPKPKDPPDLGDAFEVRLTVRDAHGLRTGSDQGWLIFSDGWVLFEGARTDFAVTRGESSRQAGEGTLALRLEDGRKAVFGPIGGPPIPNRLDRAFGAWEVAPIPDGEALLPPRERHAEVVAERHGLCLAGLIVSLGILGFGITVGSIPISATGLITAGFALVSLREHASRVRQAVGEMRALPGNKRRAPTDLPARAD